MLVLAIWLFLAGYTIAIAGKRNLGVSYQPQPDGSIKAVDGQGSDAKAYSLMDVISCGEASVAIQGQPSPLATGAPARPAGAAPAPARNPAPVPVPNFNPVPALEEIPRPRRVVVPNPGPGGLGIVDDIATFEEGLSRRVYDAVNGLVHGIGGLVSGVHLPGLPSTPRPVP